MLQSTANATLDAKNTLDTLQINQIMLVKSKSDDLYYGTKYMR